MMTVHEVSRISGVSIRALHHYDRIGLLPATAVSPSGYRLYDEAALERLQQILLFRELEFPLKEIRQILDSPGFDKSKALEQQIRLLELKKEHLENLIDFARGIKAIGVKYLNYLNFEAFDTGKIDEYAAQAKATWGKTEAYREYEKKSRGRTKEDELRLGEQMMDIFAAFGTIRDSDPSEPAALELVGKLKAHITENYYTCTDKILLSLGKMYAGGGDIASSIDQVGGEGTAVFAYKAIENFIQSQK